MANGLLFIIAGLAPLIIYMVLGDDGALGILDSVYTERIATWFTLALAIALMMKKDTMQGGNGYHIANAGFLIVIIASAGGIIVDAFNGAGDTSAVEILAPNVWSTFMMGMFVTSLGYFLQKNFPIWVPALGMITAAFGFVVMAFGLIDPNNSEDLLLLPVWIGFILSTVLYGVFTIREQSN